MSSCMLLPSTSSWLYPSTSSAALLMNVQRPVESTPYTPISIAFRIALISLSSVAVCIRSTKHGPCRRLKKRAPRAPLFYLSTKGLHLLLRDEQFLSALCDALVLLLNVAHELGNLRAAVGARVLLV